MDNYLAQLVPSLLQGLVYNNDDLINIMDSENNEVKLIDYSNLEADEDFTIAWD